MSDNGTITIPGLDLKSWLMGQSLTLAGRPMLLRGDYDLWAYLNQDTLYLSRADSFAQNGETLEVKYNVG